MKTSGFKSEAERGTFPVLGFDAQPDVLAEKALETVGSRNPELRELEGVGVVASAYEPMEPTFNQFGAPLAGYYRLRFNAYSVWVGRGEEKKWYIPDFNHISRGHRDDPVTIPSELPPRLLRTLGDFDAT